jgi:hypothetical protein
MGPPLSQFNQSSARTHETASDGLRVRLSTIHAALECGICELRLAT